MTAGKTFQWLIAIIAWLAAIVQLYLMLQNRVATMPETIIRFFSFFTILTNILVAIAFSSLATGNRNNFFSKPSVLSAITVYIFIVGLVYNTALRSIWEPKGLQLYVDEALHVVTPVFCWIYWFLYVPGRSLHWKNIFSWLSYPLVYLAFVLIRGFFSHFYPYFFINADELGFSKVLLNSILITLAFGVVSLLIIWINRSLKK